MKLCTVPNCCSPTESQGARSSRNTATSELRSLYCRKHVRRFLKYGTCEDQKFSQSPLLDRLMRGANILGEDDCWEWKQSLKGASGYGNIWDNRTKSNRLAHRVSFELAHGFLPCDAVVMHSCDNKLCINPKHLSLGTVRENTNDAIERGLRPPCAIPVATGENNPKSKLTLEQAKFIKAHPEIPHTELARMYGLSPNCIRGVRIGRTWKDA